ncbi:MAG TPA: alpha/beta hydrolase [Candidatus Sulfotelmatobacter sp.]|nr:alpha/beta hydrolase [Candidatus Sulfotelmatobacter sp.]
MNTFEKNATVVLVHGAWADGSSWSRVIGPLREAGLGVICAPVPLSSLSEDITAVTNVVERVQGPVILAGHAYGGAPMAGVTDDRVKGLVYVAALAPDAGETVAEVFYREKPHPQAPALAPDAHGYIWMPESGFPNAFAQDAPQETFVILNAIQRPISVKCIQEKAPVPAWKSKPSWFLVAERDRMIPPATQRFMAERMKAKVLMKPIDHTPSITAPEVVVEILIEAANSVLKRK